MSPSSERECRPRAEVRVDLDAIQANVETLRRGTAAEVMAVVKADGYGHGMLPCARAAVAGGAQWLGTAVLEEAVALRAGGIDPSTRVLAWLATPGEDYAPAIAADVDLSVNAPWGVDDVVSGARAAGRRARVHLKVDSGLGRGGASIADWAGLVGAARRAEASGEITVVGLWSHLAYADAPGHPTIGRQAEAFREAVETAERLGVRPEVRHLANSAATLTLPDAHFDLVRPGIAVYGLSPVPGEQDARALGLRPAMTYVARLALVKRLPGGHGVSYGHRYTTPRETTVGLVPVGYADGIPRSATNVGPLLAAGRRRTIAGTVCMDQLVVDLGDDAAAPGDEVVLFGPGDAGEPTAQDWADAVDTISYEIVVRAGGGVGARVVRTYTGGPAQ